MARVLIATQSWGIIIDPFGDPQPGMAVTYTQLDGVTAVSRFAGPTGGTTTAAVTDSSGIVPGYLDPGSYLMTAGGVTRQVEAVSGVMTGLAGPVTIANSSSSHAMQLTNNTTGDASSETLDVISNNEDDTAFGLRGVEKGRGTIKATHLKPPSGADDTNASVLSLRLNGPGGGTAAQGIFVDSEDGPTTGKLINWRQAGVERFVLGPDGDILTGGNNFNDFFLRRRAASIATMPDLLAQAVSALTSGTVYGAVAFAMKAGTYNTIRFCTSATAPSGLTDVRMGVWNSAGVLLGSTGNISASVTTINSLVEVGLTAGVVLTENQQVYLGLGWIGTALGMRVSPMVGALVGTRTGRTFGLSRTASGYAGGALPALGAGTSGILPWMELI